MKLSYFDSTLELDPIEEQQSTPVLPEERHVFELIGFERSQPDEYRKEGGIKWTFLVYEEDGRTPFVFRDEHYQFFRTTGVTKEGKPNFNVGTFANDWASALLGRPLGVDGHFQISELRGKRMSAMVTWKKQRSNPQKKSVELASLRHAFTGPATTAPPPGWEPTQAAPPSSVSADASDEDIDRALLVSKINKSYTRLVALDPEAAKEARKAIDASDFDAAPLADLDVLAGEISAAIRAAIED